MSIKRLKVPEIQYREAVLTQTGDGEAKKLGIGISSDTPYKRYDYWNDEEYWEVLSHKKGDVDESRLKAGCPILFNHKRDSHLGRARSYVNDGHSITLNDPIRSDSPDAAPRWKDVDSGVLVDTSVGYTIENEGVCTGEKEGLPVYEFKWAPFEGSLVTVPADFTVGVGRQRAHEMALAGELGKPREVKIRNFEKSGVDKNKKTPENEEKQRARSQTDPQDPMPDETEAEKKARLQREKEERKAQNRAREAAKSELTFLFGRATAMPESELQTAIDAVVDADTEEERQAIISGFQNRIFKKYFGNANANESTATPGEGDQRSTASGAGPEDARQAGSGNGGGYSRAIVKSVGQRFVEHAEFKPVATRGRTKGGRDLQLFFPDVRSARAMSLYRDNPLVSTTGGGAAIASIEDLTNVITVLQQRLTIADLLGQGATDKEVIRYPQQQNYNNTTATVAQATAKPEVNFDFVNKIANVTKIAGWTKIADEVLADFPFLISVINQQLPFMVQQTEEAQLLNGDGDGENLTGLLNTEGIQEFSVGEISEENTVADYIMLAATDIRTLAFLEPDGIVMNPYDWQTLKLSKDANGQYYAGGPFMGSYGNGAFVPIERVWGLPVVHTTAMQQGTMLVGAFKIATMIARRQGVTVDMTNSDQDDFIKNLITIRAEERLALLVWRPAGLCALTDIPAPAQ